MRNANGYGSIYKIKGKKLRKPYIVRAAGILNNDGIYIRKVIGRFANKMEAIEFLANYNAMNNNLDFNEITLEQMFEKWKISKHANSISEIVYENYIKLFETHLKHLFKKTIRTLKYFDFQPILDSISKKPSQDIITILRWIYSECRKCEITHIDISQDLSPSENLNRKIERVVFPDSFVKKLWSDYYETNNIFTAIYLILFYSGMRSNEILKLKNKDIFLDENYFITGSKTKAGRNRVIPIHYKIKPIIEFYKNNDTFLFPEIKKDKLSYWFKKIEVDGVSGNLHSIRHTFITKMQRLNDSISKIQKIVGHSTSNVTDGVYTHWSVEDLLEILNKLEY